MSSQLQLFVLYNLGILGSRGDKNYFVTTGEILFSQLVRISDLDCTSGKYFGKSVWGHGRVALIELTFLPITMVNSVLSINSNGLKASAASRSRQKLEGHKP